MAVLPIGNCFPLNQQADEIRKSQIADSGLDVQWLLDKLWRHSVEFHDVLGDGRVVQITSTVVGEDKGFLSKIYKTVFWFDGAPTKSFSVVVKEASIAQTVVTNAYNVECEMYEILHLTNCIPLPTLHEAYALAGVHQALFSLHLVSGLDGTKDDYSPSVFNAFRHKLLLRAEMALRDAVSTLRRYAPTYLLTEESK